MQNKRYFNAKFVIIVKIASMRKVNFIVPKYLFPFILIPLFYFPGYISNDFLIQAAKEDGFYQNLGALFFLLTAIAFFVLAARPKLYRFENKNGKYTERLYFLLLGILFVFAFGEEISWGQRIFDYATPEAVKEVNVQGEFNLHNMEIFHGLTREGEKKTGVLGLFSMQNLFYLVFFTYLVIIPLLYGLNARFRAFINRIRLPVPFIIIGVLFCFNWFFGNAFRAQFSHLNGHRLVEIKETVFALILFALPLSWMKFKNIKKRTTT